MCDADAMRLAAVTGSEGRAAGGEVKAPTSPQCSARFLSDSSHDVGFASRLLIFLRIISFYLLLCGS